MKKLLTVFLLLLAMIIATTSLIAAQETGEIVPLTPAPAVAAGEMRSETTHLYFVELAGAPTHAGGRSSELTNARSAFRAEARKAGIAYTERYSFETLWNGLSVAVNTSHVARLRSLPSVVAIYPVFPVEIPDTTPAEPELFTALAMTGADIVQSELGYDGTGVKVAVMDTGVDYDHPDLGGCFGAGCRVSTGWDFVGDAYNADPGAAAYNPVPSPDDDPDDCNGHGTHVAGIVGADGEVVGVAPGVTFGAYRVFGCAGSTTADIMIAAMERAYDDDMDVLNMSIGSAFMTWPQYPTAAAADALVDNGMVVVASIGNSGASGVYSAGAPGVGEKVIGVASFDNTHVALNTFTVTPADLTIGYANAAAAPPAPMSGSLPLAKADPADGCAPFAPESYAGQAVLIQRGTCPFYDKALNAQNAGAAAVVLYNNVAGRFSPTVAGVETITIPVVAISLAEGEAITAAIASEPQTLNWQDETGTFDNPTGGLISSFSSYGLDAELGVKPDIGAPGGLIYSTYPLENGAYATISGTSMASPHVAGAVALLLEARPNTPAGDVRAILQNSADPKPWWGNPGLGFLDMVHRQGAGMLDIDDSIQARALLTPSKLSLGESEAGPAVRWITIENNSNSVARFEFSHQAALATGPNSFTPPVYNAPATVTFSPTRVSVPANSSASFQVTITPLADLPENTVYGGYIAVTERGTDNVYRVPYAGMAGDYQAIQVLAPGDFGFPLVGVAVECVRILDGVCIGGTYELPPPTYQYKMSSVFQQPALLLHFAHQARYMEVIILNAATGQPVHPTVNKAAVDEYLPRNATGGSFFAYAWDGTRSDGEGGPSFVVPDGRYNLQVRVLKALGDPDNPAHWETWTSPVIRVRR